MAGSPWGGKRRVRPRVGLLVALGVAALLAAGSALFPPHQDPIVGHAEVLDGDTLRLGSIRVRLAGLDAPELDQTCSDAQGRAWSCGRDAKTYLAALVAEGEVRCAPSGRDRYARILAHCSVTSGDIGQQIVSAGWAVPDMGYYPEATRAEARRVGIWSGSFVAPAQWRRTGGEPPVNLWEWISSWFS